MTLQFSDMSVPYERFVNDVAVRVAALIKSPAPEYISQNEAFRRFGRRNVERWRRQGKIEPFVRPGKLEYQTADLQRLKSTRQDYFK